MDCVEAGYLPSRTRLALILEMSGDPCDALEKLKSQYITLELYVVPGGRYLVTSTKEYLGIWDLSSDAKLMWATTVNIQKTIVHPTPDGLVIRISIYLYINYLVYDIPHCLILSLVVEVLSCFVCLRDLRDIPPK